MSSGASIRPCPQCGTMCNVEHHYCPGCGFPIGTLGTNNEDKFVGQQLPGGYHILDLISVGGMGRVYRAEQSVLGRTVAVKIIHPHLLSDENSAVRFMTEARAASQLNHPNSIAVFDFGRTNDGQPYLVMEFLRGKDLARVAYEEGPLSFSRIVDVLRQVLAALTEAHDLGIVHRDLKPENIMLEPLRRGGDFVKVLDFGLAKLRADGSGVATNVTSPGIVCGTPDYMAPEQGRGDAIDGRSDVYAVGIILFQLLTGRLPFEADSPTQVVMMHLSIPVPDPRQVAPERNIPQPLVDVCLKALQKDAAKRFEDATEYSDALRDALEASQSRHPAISMAPGASVPPANLVRCGACESTVPPTKFCGECGAPLGDSARPASIDDVHINGTRKQDFASSPTQASVSTFPLPFIGRDEDLAWLDDRRNQAGTGILAAARLVGEPGSGKTRLIEEFLVQAEARGDITVRVEPDPWWSEAACHVLKRIIVALTGITSQDVRSEDALASVNADARRGLTELFAGGPRKGDRYSPPERRHAYAEALRWALEKAGETYQDQVIIIAVDELHRVDGPSRAAIADVVGEPLGVAGLILAAHGTGFEANWGAEHGARVLEGLPPPKVSRLLAGNRAHERMQQALEEMDRGVLPLYLDQLVRFSLEAGDDAPTRLGDLVAARLDMLDGDSRRLLQAIAVLGDECSPESLVQMLGVGTDRATSVDKVKGDLAKLDTSGMVRLDGGRASAAHPLIHDVVLAGIPAAVRRSLHDRALRVCEDNNAPLEAQAIHAYFAQDSFQALLLLEQVADRANARGDVKAEVHALRRGLELARMEISRGELDDPLQAMLIFGRKLGSTLTTAGNYADAEGVLREALDIAGPSGRERARVLGALAHVAHGRRREKEALGFIDQAIITATESGAHELVSTFRDTRRGWA